VAAGGSALAVRGSALAVGGHRRDNLGTNYLGRSSAMIWPALINTLLGLWLIVSPTILQYGGVAATNDVALGITIVCITLGSIILLPEFTTTSWLVLFSGIWVVFAPVTFGYQQLQMVATNDVAIGLLVTIVAGIRVCMPARPHTTEA
jgi:hypothetical protein